MRKWINLVEGSFQGKPSFSLAVTDELISEIMSSGKWVDHGGDLEDWWDQNDEYMYVGDGNVSDFLGPNAAEICAKPWDEVKDLPGVRQIVKTVLLQSAAYYDEHLNIEGMTWLYRGIVLPDGTPFDSTKATGHFWSTDTSQALRFMDNESVGRTGYMMQVKVMDCDINWPETIRSRLDQFHGDENEIQLTKGSPIKYHVTEYLYGQSGPPKAVKQLGWFKGTV